MRRKRKIWVNLSMKINKDVAEKLEMMNADTGIPKTIIVEKAVSEYVDRYLETGKLGN